MPTYTLEIGSPDDGTFEVGEGPFPELPAGTFSGNFYGNDPTLGRIRAGDQRYSLPSSPEDASSSGNTFQVGTGPQPELPSGRFLPEEVKSFFRDQERAAAAAAAAAEPPPPRINFTTPATALPPAQTTLPNPVTPVAVPNFVPATGIPNFGVNNLLAAGVPGATGAAGVPGVPGVPGIVSPLQSLLPPPSTVPATGSNTLGVPNISSSVPASVFSQLFPSIPDISQTPPATVAHGGPILASDSLPTSDYGESLKQKIINELMKYLPPITEKEAAALQELGVSELYNLLMREKNEAPKDGFKDQPFGDFLDDTLKDRTPLRELPSPRDFVIPSPEPRPPVIPYKFGPDYFPPEYKEPPTTEDPPERPPPVNPFDLPLLQVAHGGPILASDFLPRYQDGGETDFPEGEMGSPFSYRPFSYDKGEIEREARRTKILSLLRKYLGGESEFPGLEDKSTSELQGMLDNLRKAMPEGMVELLEREIPKHEQRGLPPEFYDDKSSVLKPMDPNDPLLSGVGRDLFLGRHDREPFFDTELMMRLQEPGGTEEYARQENIRRSIIQGREADLKRFRIPNYLSPLGRPDLRPGELQGAANGGPILASEYLNAGGPVQYFNQGQGVYGGISPPGEEEPDFSPFSGQGVSSSSLSNVSDDVATSIIEAQDIETDPNSPVEVSFESRTSTPLSDAELGGPPDAITSFLNKPRTIGPFSFSLFDLGRTAVQLGLPPAVQGLLTTQEAFSALDAINQGRRPSGLIGGIISDLANKASLNLKGTLDIETPQNQAPEGSAFGNVFGLSGP